MKQGKIIYQGKTKDGTKYYIRYLHANDVRIILDYFNTLSDEHTFISYQGEHLSLEEEQKYVDSQLKKLKEKKAVQLLVFSGEKLIGVADLKMQERIEKHIGVFGITLAKAYRGKGIGTKLLEITLCEASKYLEGLRIIKLGVFANNTLARSLYKKYGFVEYGCLPGGIVQDGCYIDHVYMYKSL
ncbi:MAG: GNAT family N-acetyltransferase [Patescibacteria group bacterium]